MEEKRATTEARENGSHVDAAIHKVHGRGAVSGLRVDGSVGADKV